MGLGVGGGEVVAGNSLGHAGVAPPPQVFRNLQAHGTQRIQPHVPFVTLKRPTQWLLSCKANLGRGPAPEAFAGQYVKDGCFWGAGDLRHPHTGLGFVLLKRRYEG